MQRPHPPITIGGGGERMLLRAVARHADIWNYFPAPLPEFEHKTQVLEQHCRDLGRDPQTLERSLMTPTVTAEWEKEVRDQLEAAKARGYMWTFAGQYVQGTPDIVVPRYRDYIRRGVSFFIVQLPDGARSEADRVRGQPRDGGAPLSKGEPNGCGTTDGTIDWQRLFGPPCDRLRKPARRRRWPS